MRSFYFIFVATALLVATTASGQFKPLKNLLSPTLENGGSIAGNASPVVLNGKMFFTASNDGVYGQELYVTDLTTAGTKLFMDLVPGPASSSVDNLVVAGDKMFFTTGDINDIKDLWMSDGTVAGTKKLSKKVNNSFSKLIPLKNSVYFISGEFPYELWRTDGIDDVKLTPDQFSLQSNSMIASGDNILYFSTSWNVTDIWATDGTPEGTKKVVDGSTSTVVYFEIACLGDNLYFVDADNDFQLVKVDASTVNGTPVTQNVDGGSISGTIKSWNNAVYFTKREGISDNYTLYRTDGTTDAILLADINADLRVATEFEGKLFFQGSDSLWYTDGTQAGTKMIVPESGTIHDIVGMGVANNRLYVIEKRDDVNFGTYDFNLWTYDDTNGLVKVLTPFHLNPLSAFKTIPSLNNKPFFEIKNDTIGLEPYTMDDSNSLLLLKDINVTMSGHYPDNLKSIGKYVFFTLDDGIHNSRLWQTDGTDDGTFIVKDGEITYVNPTTTISVHKNLLFFTASNGTTTNVWRSDGTEAGTFKIENATSHSGTVHGPDESSPVIGDFIYYQQTDKQLWKTDGSANGTVLVKDLGVSFPYYRFAVINNKFFFIDDSDGLWRSDGTADGTVNVFNLQTAFGSDGAAAGGYGLYSAGDKFFMLGSVGTNFELLSSDGTQSGTVLLTKIKHSDGDFSNPILGVLKNKIYFRSTTDQGDGLWESDGTVAGTVLLKTLDPSAVLGYEGPQKIYNDDHVIYFESRVGGIATVWQTNGTANGTAIVKTINTAGGLATKLNSTLYFTGLTADAGQELWKLDGTDAGTKMIGEIIPGPANSIMADIEATSNTIIMVGRDPDHPYGLWAMDLGTVDPSKQNQQIDFPAIGDKNSDDAPFTLTATASSGLPVDFEIVSGPATIAGDTLTITGDGDVVVRAIQYGSDAYNPASTEQTFIVKLILGLGDENGAVTISPNPATNTLLIETPSSSFKNITLKDMLGRDALIASLSSQATTVDVATLPRGMYVVRLTATDGTTATRKIVLH